MGEIATEAVYATDRQGIRRLIAAAGDVIPDEIPDYGIVTPRDSEASAVEPREGYGDLTEDEVVELLPTLSDDEVKAIQAYEAAHLARGSIVRYGRASKPVDVPKRKGRKPSVSAPAEEFGDVDPSDAA